MRLALVSVPSADGTATVGEYAAVPTYTAPGVTAPESSPDGRFFEHVGLTRVDDRIMLTVEVIYGDEYLASDQPGGDPATETPANVQFGLVRAAADRLGR